jgi:hypothetical protein
VKVSMSLADSDAVRAPVSILTKVTDLFEN